MKSCLYKTTIIHERFNDFKNKFKYLILSMYIDYDELKMLSDKIRFFSFNKFNIFSFNDNDHGYRDGRSLRVFIEDHLKLYKINYNDIKIKIFCFPRIFGYVFNPISIIYCYYNSNIIAIFYEVKNTSNEQHTYCFAKNDSKKRNQYIHSCDKNFYVSPFIGMKGLYKFKNSEPKEKISIVIDLFDKNNLKILTASQYGERVNFSSSILLKQVIINPLLIVKVILSIMYEAIFIVFKGGKYYGRNKKKLDSVSFEGNL